MITIQDCILPIGLIVLLFFSAFFSGAEIGITAINRFKLTCLKKQKRRNITKLVRLMEPNSGFLDTILIGNNLVNTASSSLATALALQLFGESGTGIATAVMTVLIIIFGEIIPKSRAAEDPETRALSAAPVVLLLTQIFKPIAKILSFCTFLVIRGIVKSIKQLPAITEEELQTALDPENTASIFEVSESRMVNNVFDFSDQPVKKVMTARTHVKGISSMATYEEVRQRFRKTGFSRLPVYKENLDHLTGIIHYKDFLFYTGSHDGFYPGKIAHPALFIPESASVSKIQELLRSVNQSIAIVIDEYGGTAGIVSIEDIVEEIFGGLADEYDKQTYSERIGVEVRKNEYLIPGKLPLDTVNTLLKTDFSSGFYETIGGFLLEYFGYLPPVGQEAVIEKTKFIVEKIGRQRIERIRAIVS